MKKKNHIRLVKIIALILIIPLLGNIFVEGWNWGVGDFIFAAIFFFITGLALDFAVRKFNNRTYRALACISIVLVMLFVWVELAVGII